MRHTAAHLQRNDGHPPGAPTGNNGQINCIKDNVDNGRTVAYSYDALHRLSTALTAGSTNYEHVPPLVET
jgi:YD repeat-containing protein